jgi:hypothetical protein
VKSRAISSEAQRWERSTTIRKEYSQAAGSGGHGNVVIWSALHGNMQRPERAGMELASHPEQKVKRAGFMWGLGRELYTSPFIWIPSDKCKIDSRNGRYTCYDRFKVAKIAVSEDPRRITGVRIVNEKSGQIVFSWKED